MSVYRPKNSPYYHYDFQLNGRRYRGSARTASRTTAKQIEATIRAEAIRGDYGLKKPDMALDVASGRYWLEVAHDQSSATNTRYQLKNLVRLLGKEKMIGTITDRDIAEMISKRRGETIQNARRKTPNPDARLVSPATVNRDTEMLRRLLYRARDVWGIEIQQIKWSIHKLPEAELRDRYLSESEEQRLFAELAPHLHAPVRFSLLTGVRLSNTISLDWSQIDLQARQVVFKVKSKKPGGMVHVLPLTLELINLLVSLGPMEAGPVFLRDGKPIRYVQTAWRGALRRAGITNFRWHDLRHTAATRMVQRGQGIGRVQKILGHSDIRTTTRYTHHDLDDLRGAMEVLSEKSPQDSRTVRIHDAKYLKNRA